MSDMTIDQVRAERAKAEAQIGDILLALHQATGLHVIGVEVSATNVTWLEERRSRAISISVTIKLEGP